MRPGVTVRSSFPGLLLTQTLALAACGAGGGPSGGNPCPGANSARIDGTCLEFTMVSISGGAPLQRTYFGGTADAAHSIGFSHLDGGGATDLSCGVNTVEMQYQRGQETFGGRGAAHSCTITLGDPAFGYKGSYSATLKTADGSGTVVITDGQFARVE